MLPVERSSIIKTFPFVGLSIVPMIFSKVVLPPPDEPKISINYPFLIIKLIPLNAATPYKPRIYVF